MEYTEGSCYCGKVTFKVKAPATWSAHCHCTQYQRLHGAAFITCVGFKTLDFDISDPDKVFKRFSTGIAEHGFCSNCGSSFFFRYTKTSDVVEQEWLEYVYFARPNFTIGPDIEPTANIFYNTHASWIENIFELPKGNQ